MRYLKLALAFALAFAFATAASADHVDPGNDTVDNGLPSGDPDYYAFSWDEGGSSFAFFDGLSQLFRFEPYLAWDDGGGLVVESLSSFDTSSFATTAGPTFTPRAGPPDSHGHVAETRANGVLSVAATGAMGDGAQVFEWDATITNISGDILFPLESVSLTLYMDADMGLFFDDDRGSSVGSTTSPFTDLILRIFDLPGSGMGLGFDALGPPSSFEIGDGGTLLGKVSSGAALSDSIDLGPGDLAAALRWDIGTLADGESASVGGLVYANPVPEPGSAALVALGLAGLAGCARRRRVRPAVLALALCFALGAGTTARAHSERETASPPRPGPVPDPDRGSTQILTVCKPTSLGAPCDHEHIQAAVDAAPAGALIRVYRGLYKEEPSRAQPDLPADNPDGTYSFAFHQASPNAQNLIAVLGGTTGKTNLTIEGWDERTGTRANPRDVVIDAEFAKHVAFRADRADGFIVRNLSVYHALEHGIYVLDQDGFITDQTVAGWHGEYGYLTFAVDHGIQSDCEAFGAGDAGLYPGGSADLDDFPDPDPVRSQLPDDQRWSVEVVGCKSYHNVLGYSGTQGDWTFIHDTEFFDNAVGMTDDSETDHPNYPQDRAFVQNNRFWDNNFNVYAENADVTIEVFFGSFYLPVGTGVFFVSGNANVADANQIWDHSTVGHWLASGQGIVIGPTSNPPADPFLSSCNRTTNNLMFPPGDATAGQLQCDQPDCANALDLSWDGLGNNNCWEGNQGLGPLGMPSQDFVGLACTDVPDPTQPCNVALGTGVPAVNALQQGGLVYVCDPTITPGCDPGDPASCDPESCPVEERRPLCFFTQTQPCFKDPTQTQGNSNGRNTAAGFVPADDPLSDLVATGSGRVPNPGGGSVTFSFDASRDIHGTTGSLKAKGPGIDVLGTLDTLHRDAWTGMLEGPCTVNGASGRCRVEFLDRHFQDATTPSIDVAVAPPPDPSESFRLIATPDAGAVVEVPKAALRSGNVVMSRP